MKHGRLVTNRTNAQCASNRQVWGALSVVSALSVSAKLIWIRVEHPEKAVWPPELVAQLDLAGVLLRCVCCE